MFLLENLLSGVLSEIRKAVVDVLPIEIEKLGDNETLFSLGCDYLDILEICHNTEEAVSCLPITFDQSNFYKLSVKDIYDQIVATKLPVYEKIKDFFVDFYKETFNKDCPEISSADNELLKDFSFESLDIAELRIAAERDFEIRLSAVPITVPLKIGDLFNEISAALVNKNKEVALAEV